MDKTQIKVHCGETAHQITLWSRVSRSRQSWKRSGRHPSKNDWRHPGDKKGVRDRQRRQREKETGYYTGRMLQGTLKAYSNTFWFRTSDLLYNISQSNRLLSHCRHTYLRLSRWVRSVLYLKIKSGKPSNYWYTAPVTSQVWWKVKTHRKTNGCVLFWHFKTINHKPCDLCQRVPFNSRIIAARREYGNALIRVWKLDWITQPHYNFPMIHLGLWQLMADWQQYFAVLSAEMDGFRNYTVLFNTPWLCFDWWYCYWLIPIVTNIVIRISTV